MESRREEPYSRRPVADVGPFGSGEGIDHGVEGGTLKESGILRDPLPTTRRRILRWMAGTAGALLAGCGVAAAEETGLPEVDWTELWNKLRTKLVPRASAAYENDRAAMVWNAAKPDRFPEAIVHVATEGDIKEAIRFARKNHMRVAVRGGGHHFNAPAVRQGGLLLDLAELKEITVNAGERTAAVQPGATARELIAALKPYGLAFPVGHCSSVALSGFLLNGGFGWNSGAWGPACLSIKGLEVVDAKGESLYADHERSPELYWAARGAGVGFFGVVTRYHLQAYRLPNAIRTSALTYEFDDADAVAAWIPTFQASLPPQVELVCLVASPPPQAQAQGAPPRVLVVSATAFADTEEDARQWLAPLEIGPAGPAPISKLALVDTPFETLFDPIDAVFPVHHRYAADMIWSNASAQDLLASVRDLVHSPPSPGNLLLLAMAPPRPQDAPPLPDMALSMLASTYVGVYGVWTDPGQDAKNRAWVRAMSAALAPHKVGRYIGDADVEADADHSRECFSASAWERLAALKRDCDPDDRFFSYRDSL